MGSEHVLIKSCHFDSLPRHIFTQFRPVDIKCTTRGFKKAEEDFNGVICDFHKRLSHKILRVKARLMCSTGMPLRPYQAAQARGFNSHRPFFSRYLK